MRERRDRRGGKRLGRLADDAPELGLDLGRLFFRIMRRSRRKTTRSGTTLVLIPPEISPTVICAAPTPGIAETRALRLRRQA